MPDLDIFKEKLKNSITANLTAKELAERIVLAALETEYGRTFALRRKKDDAGFTLSAGFAKMVNTLADSIVANPELRRQALSIASIYNCDHKKDLAKTA